MADKDRYRYLEHALLANYCGMRDETFDSDHHDWLAAYARLRPALSPGQSVMATACIVDSLYMAERRLGDALCLWEKLLPQLEPDHLALHRDSEILKRYDGSSAVDRFRYVSGRSYDRFRHLALLVDCSLQAGLPELAVAAVPAVTRRDRMLQLALRLCDESRLPMVVQLLARAGVPHVEMADSLLTTRHAPFEPLNGGQPSSISDCVLQVCRAAPAAELPQMRLHLEGVAKRNLSEDVTAIALRALPVLGFRSRPSPSPSMVMLAP